MEIFYKPNNLHTRAPQYCAQNQQRAKNMVALGHEFECYCVNWLYLQISAQMELISMQENQISNLKIKERAKQLDIEWN